MAKIFPIFLKRNFFIFCIATILGGCISGLSSRVIYDLSEPDPRETSSSSLILAQILIQKPDAIQALNTKHIAVFRDNNKYSYFADAAWSDELPNLIQARLVEAFENTRSYLSVGKRGQGLKTDYRLVTDIRSFQINENGDEKFAKAEFSMKIIGNDGRSLADLIIDCKEKVEEQGVESAVRTLNNALDGIFLKIITWSNNHLGESTINLINPDRCTYEENETDQL